MHQDQSDDTQPLNLQFDYDYSRIQSYIDTHEPQIICGDIPKDMTLLGDWCIGEYTELYRQNLVKKPSMYFSFAINDPLLWQDHELRQSLFFLLSYQYETINLTIKEIDFSHIIESYPLVLFLRTFNFHPHINLHLDLNALLDYQVRSRHPGWLRELPAALLHTAASLYEKFCTCEINTHDTKMTCEMISELSVKIEHPSPTYKILYEIFLSKDVFNQRLKKVTFIDATDHPIAFLRLLQAILYNNTITAKTCFIIKALHERAYEDEKLLSVFGLDFDGCRAPLPDKKKPAALLRARLSKYDFTFDNIYVSQSAQRTLRKNLKRVVFTEPHDQISILDTESLTYTPDKTRKFEQQNAAITAFNIKTCDEMRSTTLRGRFAKFATQILAEDTFSVSQKNDVSTEDVSQKKPRTLFDRFNMNRYVTKEKAQGALGLFIILYFSYFMVSNFIADY